MKPGLTETTITTKNGAILHKEFEVQRFGFFKEEKVGPTIFYVNGLQVAYWSYSEVNGKENIKIIEI
jgi:hypothetical protein